MLNVRIRLPRKSQRCQARAAEDATAGDTNVPRQHQPAVRMMQTRGAKVPRSFTCLTPPRPRRTSDRGHESPTRVARFGPLRVTSDRGHESPARVTRLKSSEGTKVPHSSGRRGRATRARKSPCRNLTQPPHLVRRRSPAGSSRHEDATTGRKAPGMASSCHGQQNQCWYGTGAKTPPCGITPRKPLTIIAV